MLRDVIIQFKAQKHQRYSTVGDWQNSSVLKHDLVTATQLESDDLSFLIAVHELVEMYLCRRDGITQQEVDEFDMSFCTAQSDAEPGEATDCPYRWEHQRAETVERVLAEILGVDWQFYQREIDRSLEGR